METDTSGKHPQDKVASVSPEQVLLAWEMATKPCWHQMPSTALHKGGDPNWVRVGWGSTRSCLVFAWKEPLAGSKGKMGRKEAVVC